MQTKQVLQELFNAALEQIDPSSLIQSRCRLEGNTFYVNEKSYKLSNYEDIYVLGSGKAAWNMAKALSSLLSSNVSSGLIVAPVCEGELDDIYCLSSDHPIPSERSIQGAKALIENLRTHKNDDLYIYLLSGGSSALIELPVEGVSLEEFQVMTDLMLKNSLQINEINTVRKHLSSIKGGRLGQYSKAEGLVLCISDVIGDDLYSIGSAPLYADTSTYADAVQILKKYDIYDKAPKSVQNYLDAGCKNLHIETPASVCSRIHHEIIGSNILAKEAVCEKAKELGLDACVIEESIAEDVSVGVKNMLDMAMRSEHKVLIFGGEMTVKIEGKGKGGRNQHAVLSMLKLAKKRGLNLSFLSAGTDGIDGNSDAAGAYIDVDTLLKVNELDLDIESSLKENDSYHFFKALDTLVITGPTGTNVMDIAILIKE